AAADGRRVSLLPLPALLPGVPAAPVPGPGADGLPAPHAPQPDLLPGPHGRDARRHRGRGVRGPAPEGSRCLRPGRRRAITEPRRSAADAARVRADLVDRAGRGAGAGGPPVIDLAYAMAPTP